MSSTECDSDSSVSSDTESDDLEDSVEDIIVEVVNEDSAEGTKVDEVNEVEDIVDESDQSVARNESSETVKNNNNEIQRTGKSFVSKAPLWNWRISKQGFGTGNCKFILF